MGKKIKVWDGSNWQDVSPTLPALTFITAKGDLIVGTAASTVTNLAVGSNGSILIADSTQTSGVKWGSTSTFVIDPSTGNVGIGTSSPSAKLDVNGSINASNYMMAGKNVIINGGMEIAQRGTTITSTTSAPYSLDRWKLQNGSQGTGTVTQDSSSVPSGFAYAFKYVQGATASNWLQIGQQIEYVNCYHLQGQTVTISFYAKSNNSSTASTNITLRTRTNSTIDSTATLFNSANQDDNVVINTSWNRYSITRTLPSTFGALSLEIALGNSLSSGDGLSFTGVQMELGTKMTPFSRAGGSISSELLLCQRYYCKSYPQGTTVPTNNSDGVTRIITGSYSPAAGDIYHTIIFPVVMRTAPSVTVYNPGDSVVGKVSNNQGVAVAANSAVVLQITDRQGGIYNNSGGSLTPQNGGFIYHYAASAELP